MDEALGWLRLFKAAFSDGEQGEVAVELGGEEAVKEAVVHAQSALGVLSTPASLKKYILKVISRKTEPSKPLPEQSFEAFLDICAE